MSITKRGLKWEEGNSLWIYLNFIPIVSGIGMLYAGLKAKVSKWIAFGGLYLAFTWSLLSSNEVDSDSKALIYLLIYLACIIHSFNIRNEYLQRMERLMEVNTNRENEITNIEEAAGNSINKSNDTLIKEIPAVTNVTSNLKKFLDINSCTEEELAELPGIGLILAKKAIKMRSEKGCFASVDEFIEKLNINPHYTEKLEEMLCCGSVQANEKPETVKVKGRMVDY